MTHLLFMKFSIVLRLNFLSSRLLSPSSPICLGSSCLCLSIEPPVEESPDGCASVLFCAPDVCASEVGESGSDKRDGDDARRGEVDRDDLLGGEDIELKRLEFSCDDCTYFENGRGNG